MNMIIQQLHKYLEIGWLNKICQEVDKIVREKIEERRRKAKQPKIV